MQKKRKSHAQQQKHNKGEVEVKKEKELEDKGKMHGKAASHLAFCNSLK